MDAGQSALNIQKPSQTGPRTQGDRASGNARSAATPAISIAPEAVEEGPILKKRAMALYMISANGAGSFEPGATLQVLMHPKSPALKARFIAVQAQ